MTRFLDGPAKGQVLTLRRAPVFLRVTERNGKFDALDLIDDTPLADEKIHLYQLASKPGYAFIDGRDPKTGRRSGYSCVIACYRYFPDQPQDSILRATDSFRNWCELARADARALP